MGTVTRGILAAAAVLTMLAPATGNAATTWYYPGDDYGLGPAGGSSNATNVSRDTATGEIRALQYQFTAISGSLGCTGVGPFAFFDVTHDTSDEAITSLTITYDQALVSPYAFMKVSVLQDGSYKKTGIVAVGEPIIGGGAYTLELDDLYLTGVVTARFGFEVSSNCPSVDGGRALFTGVGFSTD